MIGRLRWASVNIASKGCALSALTEALFPAMRGNPSSKDGIEGFKTSVLSSIDHKQTVNVRQNNSSHTHTRTHAHTYTHTPTLLYSSTPSFICRNWHLLLAMKLVVVVIVALVRAKIKRSDGLSCRKGSDGRRTTGVRVCTGGFSG